MTRKYSSPFDTMPRRPEPRRITSLEQIKPGLDGIYDMGAAVIDLIPASERQRYNYFRGASLGSAVTNLLNHGMLNTAHDYASPRMHFASGVDAYPYASAISRSIARGEGYTDIQFPMAMRNELSMLARRLPSDETPGIIFGLHPDLNDLLLRESDRGNREGVVWDGAVTLDMIDRHTKEALERITDGEL